MLKGAGENCIKIMIVDDILYQACLGGDNPGITMFKFDLSKVNWRDKKKI